jgi:hypothetical protein
MEGSRLAMTDESEERLPLRTAACRCGRLQVECRGDPIRVSACHCLECQRRTGSAFSVQARWPADRLRIIGGPRSWTRAGDSGARTTYLFCGQCGSTVACASTAWSGVTAVPVGALADPRFPPPRYSFFEATKHSWAAVLGEEVEHRLTN